MPVADLITLLSGAIQLFNKLYDDYKAHQQAEKSKELTAKTLAFMDDNKFKAGDTSDLEKQFSNTSGT